MNLSRLSATRLARIVVCILVLLAGSIQNATSNDGGPLIGDITQSFTLAKGNTEVRGLDFDDPQKPEQLFVLDRSAYIFVYELPSAHPAPLSELKCSRVIELSKFNLDLVPTSPRGLAVNTEDGDTIIYFLNWASSGKSVQSQLWRLNLSSKTSSFEDMSLYRYRIGDRELLDVAFDGDQAYISYDASTHVNQNQRVLRGLVQLRRTPTAKTHFEFVRHLPDSGTEPSRGLAHMEMDGNDYLWETVGNDHIACADAITGQYLFFFSRPTSDPKSQSVWGMACGAGSLWVSENTGGANRVHRVNVTENPDAARLGPRVLRHLEMTINTRPLEDGSMSGAVFHNYSRPYAFDQLQNQGVWPDTESVLDVSSVPNASIEAITIDPAGDKASRQHMSIVKYSEAPAREYNSRYEIDLWTNPYRKYVYPHRANRDVSALKGTDYLADDPDLYNLNDKKTYDEFFERVRTHIVKKYGTPADLENPYWAARNVVEYIQDQYYYPNREKRIPAAVDYARKHYDANPGNLKIELSNRPYDQSQIIACSGTSVMVAGAVRYLGIPARWLGTGTQQSPSHWDTNRNGLLDANESAQCTNGHRYTQVWLGSNYGWICFDATPTKPPLNDYDPPPPLQTQWRFMTRAAGGHRLPNRIIFNVGSGLNRHLYRDFIYDEELAIDNNCGGDQRYNLQGRFEFPEKWKTAGQRIYVKNLCFIEQILLSGPSNDTRISWKPTGAWSRDPEATVSVFVQKLDKDNRPVGETVQVAHNVPYAAESTTANLSMVRDTTFRVLIQKDGDPETGGYSKPMDFSEIFDFKNATRDVPKPVRFGR